MRKNYYLILGVSAHESPRGIQEAFRELAKKTHPDVAGPEGTRAFQEILEAYEVLSDPEKRRRYNQELARAEEARPAEASVAVKVRRSFGAPEAMSLLREFQTIRPSFDALFERLLRNFTGRGIPKAERAESLDVEIALSPEEAGLGTTIALSLPVFYACAACGGTGYSWPFPCRFCGGEGLLEKEEVVPVRIPPMIPDRATIDVPVQRLGIRNLTLRLHIRLVR